MLILVRKLAILIFSDLNLHCAFWPVPSSQQWEGGLPMNAGKTVFAQILEHLPRYEFDKFVEKYEGNHRVRRFPCYDQFLCLAYAPELPRKCNE